MNKQEWEKLYDILNEQHNRFLFAYGQYKDGKNKKIRADAEREVDNAIELSIRHIRRYKECYELLVGEENVSNFDAAIILDDFQLPRHFKRDMGDLLDKIKENISNLDE